MDSIARLVTAARHFRRPPPGDAIRGQQAHAGIRVAKQFRHWPLGVHESCRPQRDRRLSSDFRFFIGQQDHQIGGFASQPRDRQAADNLLKSP